MYMYMYVYNYIALFSFILLFNFLIFSFKQGPFFSHFHPKFFCATPTHTHTHTHVHIHTHTHIHIHVHTHTHLHPPPHTHTHTHLHPPPHPHPHHITQVWNLENMLPILALQRHEKPIQSLALCQDFVFSGSEDMEIKVGLHSTNYQYNTCSYYM